MAKVQSTPELYGSTVNVPHTEHRNADDHDEETHKVWEKNSVTFDSRGFAKVSKPLASALLEFYPNQVRLVRN